MGKRRASVAGTLGPPTPSGFPTPPGDGGGPGGPSYSKLWQASEGAEEGFGGVGGLRGNGRGEDGKETELSFMGRKATDFTSASFDLMPNGQPNGQSKRVNNSRAWGLGGVGDADTPMHRGPGSGPPSRFGSSR
jgi:hypothetical protein